MSILNIGVASKTDFEEKLDAFRKRPIEEIMKIKPVWACGKDVDKLIDHALHPSENEYVIVYVHTAQLIELGDFMGVNPYRLLDNKEGDDMRITMILSRWEQNGHIDPPTIYEYKNNGYKVAFSDGRHRTIAAYHLNEPKIPVAIHKPSYGIINSIIKLYQDM